jgi:thioredoxin 1
MTDPGGLPVELTDATFDSVIAEGVVLVDFWASWCAPCHALIPVLEELAEERSDTVAMVDVSEFPGLGDRFRVTSLPTLLVFRDGVEVKKLFGVKNRRQLNNVLDEARSGMGGEAVDSAHDGHEPMRAP